MDSVTISNLKEWSAPWFRLGRKTSVQLKDADPNELQLFIDKLPASIKGKETLFGFGNGVLAVTGNEQQI